MRFYLSMIIALAGLTGCAAIQGPGAQLVETQSALMAQCDSLGVLNETVDAGRLSTVMARRAMVRKIEARAVQLGATHIVWLHQTDTSAAAKAYQCAY